MAPTIAPAPAPTVPARAGSWGWQQRGAQFYCLLVLFGFPLFSVPCQKGTCTCPLDVVMTYVYTKDLVPEEWTKALLYPATLMLKMETLMGDEPQNFQLPEWDSILSTWNLSSRLVEEDKAADQVPFSLFPNLLSMFDSHNPERLNWEFVGACAVCLIGGILSIGGPNKISFWGILLVLWFIFVEGGRRGDVFAQPMFLLAVVCSLGWVNLREIFSLPREEQPTAPTVPTADDAKSKVEFKKKQ